MVFKCVEILTDMTQISVLVVIRTSLEQARPNEHSPKGVIEIQTLPDTRAYAELSVRPGRLFQSPSNTLTSKITVATSTLVPGT